LRKFSARNERKRSKLSKRRMRKLRRTAVLELEDVDSGLVHHLQEVEHLLVDDLGT